jgi:prolyl-tRNA editing enzyme YbaK/EbsC (Cys-tRNA(Pro) deacylase)
VAKGVNRFLAATSGLDIEVVTHAGSTHTAEEAAAAVGAPVAAIVKSLLFMANGLPLLVLASGPNRVDSDVVGEALGLTLNKATANEVKEHTGFSIGGVPPLGHPTVLRTVMDEDLVRCDVVWAAAGSSSSVFSLTPARLQELTSATVMPVH